jgi:bifunctional DNA-binding transcriptional regulator/antitoxin component of YhaV-PrlF toxin-antitoxin module
MISSSDSEARMSMSTLAPQKTDLGWVIEVPMEIARVLGVAEGSFAVLSTREGRLEVEILPPPTAELIQSVRETCEEFKDAFDEMKRLGD